jgi:hypothetical protein
MEELLTVSRHVHVIFKSFKYLITQRMISYENITFYVQMCIGTRGRHSRDSMVVGYTTSCAISACRH